MVLHRTGVSPICYAKAASEHRRSRLTIPAQKAIVENWKWAGHQNINYALRLESDIVLALTPLFNPKAKFSADIQRFENDSNRSPCL